MGAEPRREPPVYRPYALLAFGTALLAGSPLGLWLLAWLYLGAPAPGFPWRLLHAELQTVGFFGTLIVGVAPHLLARFTGRPVAPPPRWYWATLAAALLARVVGAWTRAPLPPLAAALAQAAVFGTFALRVRRALDPPPLALARRQLTLASAWLALACLAEAATRGVALAEGLALPDLGTLRAAHAMALFGGVMGWILGVLLRAGPMFVPDWRVPLPAARAVPWLIALGVGLTIAGETGRAGRVGGLVLAGQVAALAAVALVVVGGGTWRRAPRALPLVTRGAEETLIFRLAAASAAVALVGSAVAAALPPGGALAPVLEDALRHLVTVGVLTAVVVAMALRLIPVLEATPLPWPRSRRVAFWSLLAAVVLRSAEVPVGLGARALGPVVPLSGVFAWLALAGVAANLVEAARMTRRAGQN